MTAFTTTLEVFLTSDDFKQGVVSSTKASWGGSDYRVELLPDGTWNVLWKNQIGNLYETPGVILPLPQVDTDGMQEYIDAGVGTEDEFLRVAFDIECPDLAQSLRDNLQDSLVSC